MVRMLTDMVLKRRETQRSGRGLQPVSTAGIENGHVVIYAQLYRGPVVFQNFKGRHAMVYPAAAQLRRNISGWLIPTEPPSAMAPAKSVPSVTP